MSDYYYNPENNTFETPITGADSTPPNRGLAIIAYCFSWVGFIIALVCGDKNDRYFKHHLNQALVINLFNLISLIPVVGWIWAVVLLVIQIMAIITAVKETTDPMPLLGGIHIL